MLLHADIFISTTHPSFALFALFLYVTPKEIIFALKVFALDHL
jgi:hypothetical protein